MRPRQTSPGSATGTFYIKPVISQLLRSYQPVAVRQQSFFINDVPGDIAITADKNIFCTLLGSVLYMAGRCRRNTCIRVGANISNGIIWISIKDSSVLKSYTMLLGFEHLHLLAGKLGGNISLPVEKENGGVVFSIPIAA